MKTTSKPTAKTSAKQSETATVAPEKAPAPSPRQTKASEILLTFEQISKKAYEIWERNGRVHGRDREDWLRAEEELKTRN